MSLKALLDRKAEVQASIDDAVASFAAELEDIESEIAAHPATFDVATSVSDDPAAALASVEAFVKRHLRRYPKTDCALALSLKGLLSGTSTKYQR